MEDALTESVIGAAMKVHRGLGPGFLESVYANALTIELKELEISFQEESPLTVTYQRHVVGEFRADFLVENTLILELKATYSLARIHEVQLVNYLVATGIDTGLLINFGASSLQFKRKARLLPQASENPKLNPVNPEKIL